MPLLLFAGVLFGSIGCGAFVYGKRRASAAHMILGFLLIAYPYFVSSIPATIGIGVGLTAALFLFKAP